MYNVERTTGTGAIRRWAVNPYKYSHPRSKIIDGVAVTAYAHPYDIPQQVTGVFHAPENQIFMKFNYADMDEDKITEKLIRVRPAEQNLQNRLEVKIGKYTGRVYEAYVDPTLLSGDDVSHWGERFHDVLAKRPGHMAKLSRRWLFSNRPEHRPEYGAVGQVIADYGRKVLGEEKGGIFQGG